MRAMDISTKGDSEKQLLARSRYFLYKQKSKWIKDQRERAKILFEEFPQLKKAYQLYIEFKDCYYMNKLNTQEHLGNWIKRSKKRKIPTMKTATKTIEHNIGGILNYLHNRVSNTSVENFNKKLKAFLDYRRSVNDKNTSFFRLAQIYA